MAFRFRLEKVLKYRRRVMEQQTRKVAEANRVVEQFQARRREVTERLNRLRATPLVGVLQVQDLIQRGHWCDHLAAEEENLLQKVEDAKRELASQRELLTKAWQEREVLEKLKKKKKEQWVLELEKRQMKDLDEMGQIRADRLQREKVS